MSDLIYTDERNQRWWERMPRQDRKELVETIAYHADAYTTKQWISELAPRVKRGERPSATDIVMMRQWARTTKQKARAV